MPRTNRIEVNPRVMPGAMPKPSARACIGRISKHARAALGHATSHQPPLNHGPPCFFVRHAATPSRPISSWIGRTR